MRQRKLASTGSLPAITTWVAISVTGADPVARRRCLPCSVLGACGRTTSAVPAEHRRFENSVSRANEETQSNYDPEKLPVPPHDLDGSRRSIALLAHGPPLGYLAQSLSAAVDAPMYGLAGDGGVAPIHPHLKYPDLQANSRRVASRLPDGTSPGSQESASGNAPSEPGGIPAKDGFSLAAVQAPVELARQLSRALPSTEADDQRRVRDRSRPVPRSTSGPRWNARRTSVARAVYLRR